MRLTLVLTIVACMNASAGTYAQQVSLSVKNATLRQVFTAIEKQTGFLIFYNNDVLKGTKPVTIDVQNGSLEQVLKAVLKEQSLQYAIVSKTIIIKKAVQPAEPSPAEIVQTPVNGVVRDTSGVPIMGVSIAVKGTKTGTATNAEGKFSIDAAPGTVLVISFIGYQPREITVGEHTMLNITLRRSVSALDEMIVKGYYATSRRLNTGSVGTVRAETIEKQPVGNVLAALNGQVPGLEITQATGVPGTGFTVRIRGVNSLNTAAYARDPLFIIDGVPFPSSNFNATGAFILSLAGNTSPFNSLNPTDIESVEVLKDADATAIYGSRGANGVILITTKKGKAGRTSVDVNVFRGAGKVSRKLDLLSTRQYLDMRYEAFQNDGVNWRNPAVTTNDLKVWDTTRYTDWQKELIGGTADYTNAQVTLSGGNDYTNYSLSGNYWKETTVFPLDFANTKISGRLGLNHRSKNDRFTVQLSTIYLLNNNGLPAYDPTWNAVSLPPVAPPLYTENGGLNWDEGRFSNPVSYMKYDYSSRAGNIVTNALFSYEIIKGLSARLNTGFNRLDMLSVVHEPLTSKNPSLPAGFQINRALQTDQTVQSWNLEPQLEYNRLLGPGKLGIMAGVTFQRTNTNTQFIEARDFPDDDLMSNLGSAKTLTASSDLSVYSYNAVFGRINYNLYNKYLVNLTARRDGSSRFGPGRQFGNFGAIGAAWIFTEEEAIKNALPFLSFGKLRASYGITGSDAIGDYAFLKTFTTTNGNIYGGISTLAPQRLYNPDFGWETNVKADVALELGFLKERILLNINYYHNLSSNQLVGYPLPRITGFQSVQDNLDATVRNAGLEVDLSTTNIKSKSFTWTTSFNISVPRNKLVRFPGLEASTYANTYAVGYPVNLSKVYDYAGVDPLTGVNLYRDRFGKVVSTTNSLTEADRTLLINTGTNYYGGMGNKLAYKGLALDFFFQFSRKVRYADVAALNTFVPGYNSGNQLQEVVSNTWRQPGDVSRFQKLTQSSSTEAYRARIRSSSDAYYMDVSFLRLNNLSLSYTLPAAWQQKMHMQNCRIYMLGQNLLTFTNFPGLDPEGTNTTLPRLSVLTLGVQAVF